jgi:hypothetical protein
MNIVTSSRLRFAFACLTLISVPMNSFADRPVSLRLSPSRNQPLNLGTVGRTGAPGLGANGGSNTGINFQPVQQPSPTIVPSGPQVILTPEPNGGTEVFQPRHQSPRLTRLRNLTADELPAQWYSGSVTVDVPSGIYQATLQRRVRNAWKPIQTKHLDGSGATLTFEFPATDNSDDYRVLGSKKRKFMPAQVTGVSQFDQEAAVPTQDVSGQTLTLDRNLTVNGGVGATVGTLVSTSATINSVTAVGAGTLTLSGNSATKATDSATITTAPSTAAAVEADIWKFSGNRLFYFNQLRGLQVFDMSDPAHPVKTGFIRMPAIGTQLQSLDNEGRRVVLFTRQDNANYWDYKSGGMLRIVDVSADGKPTVVKTITLDGYAGESRLMGSKLYVITTGYGKYSYGTLIINGWYRSSNWWHLHGYDLADPAAPVDLGFVSGNGYAPVLQASGGYLLVASSNYSYTYTPSYQWRYWSYISAVDFESDGKPHLLKTVETKQQVRDLFKMGVVNDAIVAITQEPSRWEYKEGVRTDVTNDDGNITTTVTNTWTVYPSKTWVETFSIDPAITAPLAQLHLDAAQGESLHATRFDGDRLYVVTFGVRKDGPEIFTQNYSWTWNPRLPRDPLFIIDLADPANPIVRGELEIPGYSTYLEPDGDRLITVGREDNDIAVSLYDVANPAAPTQLQRVYPGRGAGTYTWSEAEWEHRAVTYLPREGKLIVPIVSSAGSSTQTVNVSRDSLALGPVVKMKDQARRGTSLKGYLVSISGRELAVHTDPPNGGESVEAAWIELAWPVEQVFEVGNYLVQIESNAPGYSRSWWRWWGPSVYEQNTVRLTTRSDPDEVIDSVALPNATAGIVSVTERNGTIYLAQLVPATSVASAQLRTWMLRVSNGKLVQVGDCLTAVPDINDQDSANNGSWNLSLSWQLIKPTWPADDKLVWFVPCQESYWLNWWGGGLILNFRSAALIDTGSLLLQSANGATTTLTTNTTQVPVETPQPKDRRHLPVAVAFPVGVSSTVTASGAVTIRREDEDLMLNEVSAPIASSGYLFFTTIQRQQSRYFPMVVINNTSAGEHSEASAETKVYKTAVADLRVLDFSAGLDPVVRNGVSVPGALLSAASVDDSGAWLITSDSLTNQYSYGLSLRSLAYDGVDAHEVDAITDGRQYTGSYDSQGNYLYHYGYSYGVAAKEGLLFNVGYEYGYNSTRGYYGGYFLARYRQQQATGKLESLGSEITSSYYGAPTIANDCLILSGNNRVSVSRINADATLTDLGFNTWGWNPLTNYYLYDRVVLSSDKSGLWMPATDYGVEWLPLSNTSAVTP